MTRRETSRAGARQLRYYGCSLFLLTAAIIASCDSTGSGPRPLELPPSEAIVEPQGTSFLVEARDIEGRPLRGVDVTLEGNKIVTDAQGRALFEGLPAGRAVARVAGEGFAPTTAVADLEEGIHGGAVVTLLRHSVPIPFDAGAGATIRHANIEVEIPPGSLVRSSGEPVTGMAEVQIAAIDPTTSAFMGMPGPLEGIAAGATEASDLSPLFLAEVSLSQGGEQLQLADGATAVIELPVPASLKDAVAPGDVISSWYYDLEAGSYQEGEPGVISVKESAPGGLVWRAPVHHFSWWCAHAQWQKRHCYDVKVVDGNGNPLGHQPVTAIGVSYLGLSWPEFTKNTGPNKGHACIDIRAGETATIYLGFLFDPQSGPPAPFQTVTAPDSVVKCGGQGGSCEQVTLKKGGGGGGSVGECNVSGATRPCEGGPAALGECVTGLQQCGPDQKWGACLGQVQPSAEICDLKDNDCDGAVDDGLTCQCVGGNASSCPGADDDCKFRACSPDGKCGTAYIAAGTALPLVKQVAGDCYELQCDGAGNVTAAPATDPLDDGNACTKDRCFFGAPVSDLLPDNTSCGDKVYCKNGLCLLAECNDSFLNGYESDIDCGGPQCSPCKDGRACASAVPDQADKNCASKNCKGGVCAPASCSNGKKDGCETDVDCGGGLCAQSGQTCTKCPLGKACEQGVRDCESTFCVSGMCSAMP